MTIPAGFGQATFIFGGAAVPLGAAITFGFENGPDASAIACANAIAEIFNDEHFEDQLCTDCNVTNLKVKLGPDETGPFADRVTLFNGSLGGGSGAVAPALLVRKITDLGGRKNRGRMYLPGLRESDINEGGVVNPTRVAAAQLFWTDVLGDLSSALFGMAVLHGDSTAPTEVTALTVEGVVATQRRRQRR